MVTYRMSGALKTYSWSREPPHDDKPESDPPPISCYLHSTERAAGHPPHDVQRAARQQGVQTTRRLRAAHQPHHGVREQAETRDDVAAKLPPQPPPPQSRELSHTTRLMVGHGRRMCRRGAEEARPRCGQAKLKIKRTETSIIQQQKLTETSVIQQHTAEGHLLVLFVFPR